eukprot:10786177-Lingulodinium_polyedra.AAC.1
MSTEGNQQSSAASARVKISATSSSSSSSRSSIEEEAVSKVIPAECRKESPVVITSVSKMSTACSSGDQNAARAAQ